MSDSTTPQPQPPQSRAVSGTENTWCQAVPGGTGITILALLLSKPPNTSLLQTSIHNLQTTHPILRSKLHFNPTTPNNPFSFLIPPSPTLHLLHPTVHITPGPTPTPFISILEHQLNTNPWSFKTQLQSSQEEVDVLRASVHALEGGKWVVVVGVHTAACDRTAAVEVLRELTLAMTEKQGQSGGVEEGEVGLGVEEYIPPGKGSKPFWARGVDMLGYSLNSFRFTNLEFVEPGLPVGSQVVRLVLGQDHTQQLLQGCKSKGIKLCGALSAAGLMAARLLNCTPDGQWEKYAVVTLIDCRKLLEPPLSSNHVGFYHSAILNTHDLKGGEELWELAKRTYTSFNDAKKANKHFSDMADLNFLMCKAIENPGLTPSSSLRTSYISVFEDPVIDDTTKEGNELGVEDCIGCASVHGVGPSIAIFDTVRNGKLDCACVYPFPLHSREQMQELVDTMKNILIGCLDSLDD